MPWTTPTLLQVRQMVRDDITMALPGAIVVGNTVMRVMADAMAGLARLVLKYLDWLALQLMPDTAEAPWLDRWGQIFLVNADGSLGRKNPALASGTVGISGVAGTFIGAGSVVIAPTGATFQTLEALSLPDPTVQPADLAVQALTPGINGNIDPGTLMTLATPIFGVDTVVSVDLRGGTELETDDQLRARVLARIRQPPMGGDADDYVQWAMKIPSVTRAWAAPRELGMGTITIRFMCDALRSDVGGFPIQTDIDVVRNYLDTVRPVCVKDFFVMSPVAEPIDFNLSLTNDSVALRSQVAISVGAMIEEKGNPAHAVEGQLVAGTTIMASWVAEAVNRITQDFDLTMDDHPMPHNGALATLGTITYPTP